ncbi:SSI family serine proteinase inhibitor [Nonomuraea sp. NPDC005983]|uniref:SSI family serine proteinase inhibitor n=1 Tax=Nonomuraea sp. NPDC005983 TaxID=3155595 RepID=UPI0033B47562
MRPAPIPTAAAAAIAALPLLGFAATVAHAASDQGLNLTVSGNGHGWVRSVQLTCVPAPSGYHPHAKEACAAIDTAGGDLNALPVAPRTCGEEHNPVTASATGTWRGRPISWQKTFDNSCKLDAATGLVFRF